MNSLLILMIILTNTFIKKDNSTNGNFYRAHEKFVADESIYKKNVSSEILMPHGDIVALDICNNINNLAQPRKQLFITDKYGYRNDKFNIENAEIILVGDSFIAGSSNTQENIPANILSKLISKKVYSLTSISGPDYYDYHIQKNLDKINKNSIVLLFYFEGNDFNYKFEQKKGLKYLNGVPIPYIKYLLGFGYERLEKNKDKIFIKFLKKIYQKNYLYKNIRPKSQRFTKKIIRKWTNSCPVEYHKIKNNNVGFYYKNINNFKNVSTHIIKNEKVLKMIKKVYFIPTKFSVYQTFITKEKNLKDEFEYLKFKYNELGIEVVDLTQILTSSANINLTNNSFIYWQDDTHWNKFGIYAAMKYISENL